MRGGAWLLALVLACTTGCTHGVPTSATGVGAAGVSAASHASKKKEVLSPTEMVLATRLRQAFLTGFNTLDADHDGFLTVADFASAPDRFAKVLGKYDTDHDGQISPAEYFTADRADELLSSIQARATVSALGVGGHVSQDKLEFMFGVYLQDRIPNAAQRNQEIDGAFAVADADHSKQLTDDEVAVSLAILEARADVIQIQHQLGSVDPTQTPGEAPVDPAADPSPEAR